MKMIDDLSNKGLYSKRYTPPNLPCQVQLRTRKWKGHLPSYLGNKGSYQKNVKGIPPLIYHAKSNYALKM